MCTFVYDIYVYVCCERQNSSPRKPSSVVYNIYIYVCVYTITSRDDTFISRSAGLVNFYILWYALPPSDETLQRSNNDRILISLHARSRLRFFRNSSRAVAVFVSYIYIYVFICSVAYKCYHYFYIRVVSAGYDALLTRPLPQSARIRYTYRLVESNVRTSKISHDVVLSTFYIEHE